MNRSRPLSLRKPLSMPSFAYTLPAVRGIQAGKDFFVTMCPAGTLASMFRNEDTALRADIESFRSLNEQRIPEIVKYITGNRTSYVFSAMTATIDSEVRFESLNSESPVACGNLVIPIAAQLVLLDGKHRCMALQEAVKRDSRLADECVPLVIFVDVGLKRSNKLFSDLKCNERKTSQSARVFHDTRDEIASLTREVVVRVPAFVDMIEMSKSTISNRSRKLFTLSALYQANRLLLSDFSDAPFDQKLRTATSFWKEVALQFADWAAAKSGEVAPADLRKSSVHVHGIALAAIARTGRTLLSRHQKTWQKKLKRLKTLDWSRDNAALWEGRAMIGGRLSKSNSSVILAGNAVKHHLGVALTVDEEEIETQFLSAR